MYTNSITRYMKPDILDGYTLKIIRVYMTIVSEYG